MDQRNLIVAIILSMAVLFTYQFLVERPRQERELALKQTTETATPAPGQSTAPVPAPAPASGSVPATGAPVSVPSSGAAAPSPTSRASVLANTPRIRIETPSITGSIALRGAVIDDVVLNAFREEVDPASPKIVLLTPRETGHGYYAEFGWVAGAGAGATMLPGPDTLWQADGTVLTPERPVTLRWENGQGLRFAIAIAVDARFMFSVAQRVENGTGQPVSLHTYSLVSRNGKPKIEDFFILHEGPLGVFNETLKELEYDDLKSERPVEMESTGGWIGITDKYWLAALIPDQRQPVKSRFSHSQVGQIDKYQVDTLAGVTTVAPGAAAETQSRLFAGAKVVRMLDEYETSLGITQFDLAIDFGWFYFLTKPIFYILEFFHGHLGNFGLAILLLTILVKLAFFPLANKSYRAMSKLKLLAPRMTEIRAKFGNDKQKMNQAMMDLYRNEKVNPMAGCLPILVQIPVFFALYKVLFVTIEMRHAPFFGWIQDLSAPDNLLVTTLFGLIPWTPPDFLALGIWPFLMGITMLLQQKLSPQPPDPMQARMFMLMPLVFTFMLARFPAGLVIYWTWNNLLSIIQQWLIMRRAGVKP